MLALRARNVLARVDRWLPGGCVLVARGRVERVERSAAAARRRGARVADLGEVCLAPGMVDAHAHLELSALAGRTPEGADMVPWVRAVVGLRSAVPVREARAAARRAARDLLAGGTTTVGDVSAPGEPLAAGPDWPRRVVLREALDAGDAARGARVLAALGRALPRRALATEGLSPHAPHTVGPELLAGLARLARRRRLPVQTHWSETREEVRWLERGGGPFAPLLGVSPRRSGLDLLEAAGLLGPLTSLVHGNHPRAGEPERIARSGATVVHCPGSHAYFRRGRFPLERYLAAGVAVALGTDSLASNRELDMRRELALAREARRSLDPARAWEMATTAGARALGLAGRVGELVPGAFADLAAFEVAARDRAAALDELTAARPAVRAVWVAGRLRAGALPRG